jgi:S1-C subfamily serine protease
MIRIFTSLLVLVSGGVWASSSGTGFFISNNGHVVTNAHVIDGAKKITIRTSEGKEFDGKVISVDESNDLALLKVEAKSKPLFIKSIEGLNKGIRVFTLGFPNPGLQGFEPKYTEGVVSSFSGLRGKPSEMQITTPIQPGNSGGPLFDPLGNVIGIIVSKLDGLAVAKKQDYLPENVNYAIKSNYLLPLIINVPGVPVAKTRADGAPVISELENSLVLIISSTQEDRSAGAGPISKPGENSNPVVPKRITIAAPDVIESGCVVPFGFTSMPSLKAGETAVVKLDGVPVASLNIGKGSLREFQYRIRLTGPSVLSVECPGCINNSFNFKKVVQGCSSAINQSSIGDIRIKVEGDTFRTLFDGVYPVGEFHIAGEGLSIRVDSSPDTAMNPFVMVKSDSTLDGNYCVNIKTPFGSKQSCGR